MLLNLGQDLAKLPWVSLQPSPTLLNCGVCVEGGILLSNVVKRWVPTHKMFLAFKLCFTQFAKSFNSRLMSLRDSAMNKTPIYKSLIQIHMYLACTSHSVTCMTGCKAYQKRSVILPDPCYVHCLVACVYKRRPLSRL